MTTEPSPRRIARDQGAIDRAAACCKDAIENATSAQFTSRDAAVQESARVAAHAAAEAMNLLVSAGAKSPVGKSAAKKNDFDLGDLAMLDDPNAKTLLGLLRQAVGVAELIDARRGRVVPDDVTLQPGESRGTDLAESLSNIRQRLKIEVYGPRGRD